MTYPMIWETHMLQNPREIDEFCDIMIRENVRSYLEIGSKFGGSFWRVGRALAPGATMVAVDLPQSPKQQNGRHLIDCADAIVAQFGHSTSVIIDDSTAPDTIRRINKVAQDIGGKFDAVFIDGGHDIITLMSDWHAYGRLGRIVAFHDIAHYRPPESTDPIIDVPVLWRAIKGGFRHVEIRHTPTADNGIGVLFE